ncbi:MAG: Gfo/Idh/MocA family oxidoreductase [Acidobacteria bacterium]|nr:Gfo/Idh/MocA family oxidoreductase [Acidobacteriota bacterium]
MSDIGADRPMRLCFLGCGRVADAHSRTLRRLRPGVTCSYASRTIDKARALAEKHGGAPVFGSYGEALASPDVDVIAVVTPPGSHLEWTLAAIDAGKDVILEKPPVLRSSDFGAIQKACEARSRFVYIAENYFYKPILAAVRDTLGAGIIGEPLFINLNAVKRQRAETWRDDPREAGGGALFEGGIHWINFAGALGFTIRSVKAARPGAAAGLERSMALLIEYDEGPVGVLSYSWEVASPLKGLRVSRIYGREGSIVFESNGLFLATSGHRWRIRFPNLGDMLGYTGMFADFLRAWRARTEPRMTLARARRDIEVIEEAYRSAGVAPG